MVKQGVPRPVLDYGSIDSNTDTRVPDGFSDGRWAFLLTLTSPLALLLSVLAYCWFAAIVFYGFRAVRRTRGRSVLGWVGLTYGSLVIVGLLVWLGWFFYVGK